MKSPKKSAPKSNFPIILNIRGTEKWGEWVDKFAKSCGNITTTHLIDEALKEFAESRGFKEPRPYRLEKPPLPPASKPDLPPEDL